MPAFGLLLKDIIASMTKLVIVVFGLVMFVVPGIIFAMRLKIQRPILIKEGVGPIKALGMSWAATRDNAWKIFVVTVPVFLVTGAINSASFMFTPLMLIFWGAAPLLTVFIYKNLK